MTNTISRRGVLQLLTDVNEKKAPKKKITATCEHGPVTSGITPFNGDFDRGALIHLLKRTLFGLKKADLDYFTGKTLTQVLDELLIVPSAITTYPLMDYSSTAGTGVDWAGVKLGETWVNNPCNQSGPGGFDVTYDNFARDLSVKRWNMGLALNQNRSIYEKLVLFWFNHMPTSVSINNRAQRAYVYAKLIRENVNTDFREMCKKITKDPAMLMYLNGEVNTSQAPDENYAREIQELFTIGKEVPADKRYNENDVKAFAKALTGHGISFSNYLDAVYQFSTFRHASGNKQLSAFYSNAVITGGNGSTAGDTELDQLINVLFDDSDKAIVPLQGTKFANWSRADIIADHIIKKVYRFFVYYVIDAEVEVNIIKPLADTYKNNGFKIIPVLRQLFSSEHFYDQAFRGAYIKMPYDTTIGLARTMEVNVQNDNPQTQYAIYNLFQNETEGMQQGALEPPNIAGWPPYYQSPNFHKLWINADTLPKRQDFAKNLVNNGVRSFGQSGSITVVVNHIEFVKTLTNPEDPNALIDELSELMLGIPLSVEHKAQLKRDKLLTGQTQDYYWTDAWLDAVDGKNTNTVISRLKSLFDYLVRLEEFQLT